MRTVTLALVGCAPGMLTCAVAVIYAVSEVFVYERYFHRAGKNLPLLRS